MARKSRPRNQQPQGNSLPSATAQQQLTNRRIELIGESHSGPLPHPETLRQYEEIGTGFADRIITMAEKQADHRMALEEYAVRSDARRAMFGVTAGLIVFLAFVVACVYLIETGYSAEGLIVGVGSMSGLVGTFIYGTISRKNERRDRLRDLTSQRPGTRR